MSAPLSAAGELEGAITSVRTGARWTLVVGLEVHVQLKTRTKLFCGCEVHFGAEPNHLTCPVCTAQPGALPVLNHEALVLAVRAGLAVGSELAAVSKFDRKNYFYPDLPKGYQISQYDQPFATGGGIRLASGRFIRLRRIHMEEDAGKTIHDRGTETLVDFNRAGVPLIESVTEADLRSSEEAHEYLVALKEILQYAGVSDCDMEKGSLRCDVNVSVRMPGEPLRTRVEIKNLNSFRHVQSAIDYEVERQLDAYESGDPARFPVQETRLFDAERGVTRTMRGKEDEADYRYFPDPDLVPITLDAVFLDRQRGYLPELPAPRRERYQREMGLSAYDAGVLTAERAVADFFEAVARLSKSPKEAANWVQNEILHALADPELPARTIDELLFRPADLAEVIALVHTGVIHKSAARQVVAELLRSGGNPRDIVEAKGLRQVQDDSQITEWCREALATRAKIVADVRAGNAKALGALIGPVMQLSGGKANPQRVRELLARLIEEGA